MTFWRILYFRNYVIIRGYVLLCPLGGLYLDLQFDTFDFRISPLFLNVFLEKSDFSLAFLPYGCVLLYFRSLSTNLLLGRQSILEEILGSIQFVPSLVLNLLLFGIYNLFEVTLSNPFSDVTPLIVESKCMNQN